jgi:type I restriction enzyme R subunit
MKDGGTRAPDSGRIVGKPYLGPTAGAGTNTRACWVMGANNPGEKRGISEQLTEQELVIFDQLKKPEINLTKAEEQQVKKVSKDLLETLKRERLVLDWKKRQTTRAAVLVTIETVLDQPPRVYTPELYEQKCQSVYQHVFDSYQEQNKSLCVT